MNKRFLKQYLIEQSLIILFLFTFLLIFTIATLLFKISISIIIYLEILFFILILFYFYLDYKKKKKNYQQIKLIKNLDFSEINQHLELLSLKSTESQSLKELINQYNGAISTYINDTNAKLDQTNEYITTWIHQIKLPITSMYLLLNEEDSNLSRELKEDLLRIELYIEMVLTYFRLESPTTDYVFKEIDLFELVKKEIKKFRNEFIRRGIGISIIPFDKSIISDEKWLSFILDQIISNSLKYTPAGKISIYFKNNSLFIKDTGIGISESNLPRIFERGFTGYNGRLNKKASGLGLYLVKRICDNLKIPINITSKENNGTLVQLILKSSNKT